MHQKLQNFVLDENEVKEIIKVGVIGVGSMGRQHARVYSELPNVKLVGITDKNKRFASCLAKKYNTKAFDNHKELIKQDLDALSIAVPTSLHRKVADDVVNAGIHVLIEKPIAHTIEDAREIIRSCRKNDVKLMIGHIERFNPIISVIKKSIENTKLVSININRIGPFPPRIRDVGVIIDLATHDIDLIRYLANSEFKKVYGVASSKNVSNHEDSANLIFEMKNHVLGQITVNWLTPFKVREINAATKEKFIRGQFIEQKVTEYYRSRENSYVVKELFVPFSEPLKLELQAFIESIDENKDVPVTGYDGLTALEIALKIRNSIRFPNHTKEKN